MGLGAGQRPLSEVSPMAPRRNSPSWNQVSKTPSGDSAAYDGSPLNNSSSPRLFWKGRDSPTPYNKGSENRNPYDPEGSYFPSQRPSLEDLKRVSRVKNHNMFRESGQEYDPTQVSVPRRSWAAERSPQRESLINMAKSQYDDSPATQTPRPPSPSKDQPSPGKSSLSKGSRYGKGFDPQSDIWSEFDSIGHRHAKSVTFDVAPPQVNEYEMTTPDPSSVASGSRENSYDSEDDEDISFEHESSVEHEDSFDASLEDIEKTPVVLPDDWRFMSPANDGEDGDPFVEHPESRSTNAHPERESAQHERVESLDSNGDPRPLPPLPSVNRLSGSGPTSPSRLAAAFELGSGAQRILPAPPSPASYSKSDLGGRMSLEERLRLMMLQEDEVDDDDKENAALRESRLRPSSLVKSSDKKESDESQDNFFSPPRISRDSILRDIRKSESYEEDDDEDDISQMAFSPHHYDHYDPDVPIPSLENDDDDDSGSVIVKEEEHEHDLYAIPDHFQNLSDNSLSSNGTRAQYDEDSSYSLHDAAGSDGTDSGHTTPVPEEQTEPAPQPSAEPNDLSEKGEAGPLDMVSIRESLGLRPSTPEQQEEQVSEPGTPDSVIRHPVEDEEDDEEKEDSSSDEAVPEPVATVRAPGAGLKVRPSLTPADMESMAATRRKISGQHDAMPQLTKQISNESDETVGASGSLAPQLALPTSLAHRQPSLMKLDIPFSIQEESLGSGLDKEFDRVIESQKVAFELALSQISTRDPRLPPLGDPQDSQNNNSVFLPPFANTSRPKQRGYLMRQNTKVIIASSRNEEPAVPAEPAPVDPRGTRSAGSSPRKASQQTWTTEPWNGRMRRPSVKTPAGIPKKKPVPSGPAPPLPGQQSNVQEATAPLEETEPQLNEIFEEGEERGRLFVKVVGIKYLDLPLPRGERSHFALTLDNGLHCVTTAWLELGKSAPIGQEFELMVQNDLEFQLTLQMKLDESKFQTQENAASSPSRQKASALSRVFASPRRRKEQLDLKQQSLQKAKDVNAPVYERLRNLVSRDGSFGRAYVSLSDHEQYAFGRPYTVDVACFNEWAVEETPSSVKSKKSATSVNSQRRPPYKIGKLELQLLFVPKPKGVKDDDMPKSMNACIREMRDAESVAARTWEGFLSQQGGDCPFWRRRLFKLQGSKLTAYHETTRQPRATINLAKAAKLIDDRSSLTQKQTSTKGGGRRKSAFAEEEEGYMFVEEGFRIRFANGEVIDFYADNAADKEGWLRVMSEVVGKGSSGNGAVKAWADFVLKRERSMLKSRRQTTNDRQAAPPGPPSPIAKRPMTAAPALKGPAAQAPQSSRPRHKHTFSQPEVRGTDSRHQKTRSLIF
ncbi:hypothetical protein N7474_007352 [Penicillium riverlandense]|uniref:uncharacterized protein n=1 Tax=Penicillium riverlandense TaxID=1903569 RepID=UPI002547BD32|nr:uncharacterized protein N7474_007352 [Penicillium riverlandense]KAJ5815575.1 hypothetical protein N7474_007352 [Penicillium riverlandense]